MSDCSLSSPFQLSLKLTVFVSKTPFFFNISTSIFKKRYRFSYSRLIFHDYGFVFLIYELLLCFEIYSVRTWVWFILLSKFDWVLVILIVRCLSHSFSWWCLCFVLCFMTALLCTYHVHGRVSQWQLFVTVWCSLITFYWVVTEQSSFLDTCYILKYTLHRCCIWLLGADLVHVLWLIEISLWIPFF